MVSRFCSWHPAFSYGTRRRGSSAIAVALLPLLGACASSTKGPNEPAPAWAKTLEAQREARTIDSAWRDGSYRERLAAEPLLLRFLELYPDDPRSRNLRLRLAWLRIQARDLSGAERLVREAATTASGVDLDAVQVLRASILARRGQPSEALSQLRGMAGHLVDAEVRELWAEEAVKVASLARADDDAVAFLLAWRMSVAEEQQERAERLIQTHLERISVPARLRALESLTLAKTKPSAEESRQRARDWMIEALRGSLGRLAESTNDAQLAGRVITGAPTKYLRSPEGERLRQLAQALDVPESVMHPAIGLLLELGDDRSSRLSAELVTGAMRALSTVGKDEPVRLITRELRAFDATEAERALTALVVDGSALIIAGLSPGTAEAAARVAEKQRIVVVLLHDGNSATVTSPFVFFVGSPTTTVERLYGEANSDQRKAVVLTSDDAFCRAGERLGWTPAFLTSRADVLVTADANCALRLADELHNREGHARVWLGPDAASAAHAFTEVSVVTSPYLTEQSDSEPVRLWRERFQRLPSWQEAVGYDVVRLGIESIRRRGFESLRGEPSVSAARAKVREELARVECPLMTSREGGFRGQSRLEPTLSVQRLRRPNATNGGPR